VGDRAGAEAIAKTLGKADLPAAAKKRLGV
jgi:hypothetical protein